MIETEDRWPIDLEQHERELLADAAWVVSLGLKIQRLAVYGQISKKDQDSLESAIRSVSMILNKIEPA